MSREKMTQPEIIEQEGVEVPEKTGHKVVRIIVNVILVAAIIVAAICTYTSYVSTSGNGVPSILGVRVFSIQTDSMYPTLMPGDLVFGKRAETSELRKGDIITYWTVINGERVLNTHRIEEIYDGGGYLIFATKGDNNTVADALTVHESEVVAKYTGVRIGSLGKVFDYLQTSKGFLIVIVIPVFIFFLFHLVQFFRVLFEYQNVKNRIKYEQERGRTEDLIAEQEQKAEKEKQEARAALEAELRERLRAEILANMEAEKKAAEPPAAEPEKVAEEASVSAADESGETPVEEAAEEESVQA